MNLGFVCKARAYFKLAVDVSTGVENFIVHSLAIFPPLAIIVTSNFSKLLKSVPGLMTSCPLLVEQ